jgi:hypothetical protein
MSTANKELNLNRLRSFSPSWPFAVRLTLAIAVQYSCYRLVQRAEAVHSYLQSTSSQSKTQNNLDDDDDDDLVERDEDGNIKARLNGWDRKQRIRKDSDLVVAWQEYTSKFLTATCQHLGIPEETLPRECFAPKCICCRPTDIDVFSPLSGADNAGRHTISKQGST